MRTIKRIIIHCSDSRWGNAEVIDDWHKARKWKGIGYHYVIPNGHPAPASKYNPAWDGKLEPGRQHEEVGAHAKGNNEDSIGICLIGTAEGLFTPLQLQTLTTTVKWLQGMYNIPDGEVIGHRDVEPGKECPGFDVKRWMVGGAG
jgi:N-acetylmuramoyl-L-alanine amidase